MMLNPDVIYEAALDDALFQQLPAILSDAMGARSCVVHWRDHSGGAGVATHNGYFSDENMALYVDHFIDYDLWTAAGAAQGAVNRAWRTSQLVSEAVYENSVFYNEWLRAIGDDTFHCVGSVMRTRHGQGIIGIHRGRTQADFDARSDALLDANVDHLRRMFDIRETFGGLTRRADMLGAILAAADEAALVIGADDRVTMTNAGAERLLREQRFVRQRGGRLVAADERARTGFEAALAEARRGTGARATTVLLRDADGTMVVATLLPLVGRGPGAQILCRIALPRAAAARDRLARHLGEAFGLTMAEADVALRLADGEDAATISARRAARIGTVRTQVKQVLAKTGTRRQGELVRLVGRLAAGLPVTAPIVRED